MSVVGLFVLSLLEGSTKMFTILHFVPLHASYCRQAENLFSGHTIHQPARSGIPATKLNKFTSLTHTSSIQKL